jgi:hypothetical protein
MSRNEDKEEGMIGVPTLVGVLAPTKGDLVGASEVVLFKTPAFLELNLRLTSLRPELYDSIATNINVSVTPGLERHSPHCYRTFQAPFKYKV